ncbi:WD40 repeat-containing protein [Nitzschia inconspicua]|uniref:WD40 repeat-containing protein n=1 Tax=Nitzschia inconspicua TaxID=303405 RepID=A0A9K3K7E6_9STRA|nr:WD40 repeat-containing protein [Nitzschia inconspicua]
MSDSGNGHVKRPEFEDSDASSLVSTCESSVLPLDLLVEKVFPFLDRQSWNNFSCASRKVRAFLQLLNLSPPWPSKFSSQDHMVRIRTLIFSHNLSQVACGCTDGKVRLWHVRTGEQKHALDAHWPGEPVVALAFSSNDTLLASASTDHTIRLWDVTRISKEDQATPRTIHSSHVSCLFFSHDQSRIVVGHFNSERISIFDVSNGKQSHHIRGGITPVSSVRLTQDGNHLIWTCATKQLKVWDINKEECIGVLEGKRINAVCPLQDRHNLHVRIASIEDPNKFSLWTTEITSISQNKIDDLSVHRFAPTLIVKNTFSCIIRFSINGTKVACVDDYRGLRLHDTRTGEETNFIKDTGLFR